MHSEVMPDLVYLSAETVAPVVVVVAAYSIDVSKGDPVLAAIKGSSRRDAVHDVFRCNIQAAPEGIDGGAVHNVCQAKNVTIINVFRNGHFDDAIDNTVTSDRSEG